MGKPYSEDLRERVVAAIEEGGTIEEVAEQYGVSISSVVRFLRSSRETGSVTPAKFGGHKPYALETHEELVRKLVAEQPDITLGELKAQLAKEKVRWKNRESKTGPGDRSRYPRRMSVFREWRRVQDAGNGAERRGLCDHQEFGAGDQTGWLGN
jgi:transposase